MHGRTTLAGIGWVAALALATATARGDAEGDFKQHRAAGLVAYQKTDYGKAIAELKEARKAKTDPGVLIEMGAVYLEWKGHAAQALQVCSQFYKEGGPAALKQHADDCQAEASKALDAEQAGGSEPRRQPQDGGHRHTRDHQPVRTDPGPAAVSPAPVQPAAPAAAPPATPVPAAAPPAATPAAPTQPDADEEPRWAASIKGPAPSGQRTWLATSGSGPQANIALIHMYSAKRLAVWHAAARATPSCRRTCAPRTDSGSGPRSGGTTTWASAAPGPRSSSLQVRLPRTPRDPGHPEPEEIRGIPSHLTGAMRQ